MPIHKKKANKKLKKNLKEQIINIHKVRLKTPSHSHSGSMFNPFVCVCELVDGHLSMQIYHCCNDKFYLAQGTVEEIMFSNVLVRIKCFQL